ncbi:glucose 1-dehydrogenase [Allorhizocola rhizosphaerae]|uniref:glucose 1-dehydrogenase n=1 Tax=Allorhizocola rhizosphaerae TaxID=1872709 RepID=UPI000E3EC9C6|nr:glucose 1-dehydrogenase [Allorhizocola rhizosphaerae]
MDRLKGKVALVTGGARGMGKSHVRHFVAEGAKVVFGDVLDDDGKRVADQLGDEHARYMHHDVTDPGQWADIVEHTVESFGRLDILVNNAGILRHALIRDMSLEDFRQVLEVNLVGMWLGVKAVIDPMTTAGGGSIINVSSIEGFAGASGLSAYSASKFGVRGVTRAAAQELGHSGIRVNSVHPGGIMTKMALGAAEVFSRVDPQAFLANMPIPRFGESAEISKLVVFLASDESSYCTGAEFVADGGMLSGPGY